MKEKIKIPKEAVRKAEKKASREVELEQNVGFKAVLKVHKSKKHYTRKGKKDTE